MEGRVINIGNKIELTVVHNRRSLKSDIDKTTYVSQILDFEDDTIIAALPIYEGHLVTLEVDSQLECYFYTQKGIYKGMAVIASRYKEKNLYLMKLELTSELKKFQRRQYFRLPCNIQVDMRPLSVSEVIDYSSSHIVADNPDAEIVSGVIVDISGGGLRIFSGKNFDKNDYVYVRFSIDMNVGVKQIELMARVVMSIESPNMDNYYDNRLQFKDISPQTRDAIVKYIFEQQRKNQNRGR